MIAKRNSSVPLKLVTNFLNFLAHASQWMSIFTTTAAASLPPDFFSPSFLAPFFCSKHNYRVR